LAEDIQHSTVAFNPKTSATAKRFWGMISDCDFFYKAFLRGVGVVKLQWIKLMFRWSPGGDGMDCAGSFWKGN